MDVTFHLQDWKHISEDAKVWFQVILSLVEKERCSSLTFKHLLGRNFVVFFERLYKCLLFRALDIRGLKVHTNQAGISRFRRFVYPDCTLSLRASFGWCWSSIPLNASMPSRPWWWSVECMVVGTFKSGKKAKNKIYKTWQRALLEKYWEIFSVKNPKLKSRAVKRSSILSTRWLTH